MKTRVVQEKVTAKTLKALRILRDRQEKMKDLGRSYPYDGMTCEQFAIAMWPDSPAWQRRYKGGHGAIIGKGIILSAGSYLCKLQQRGLVESQCNYRQGRDYQSKWVLSREGRRVLEETA